MVTLRERLAHAMQLHAAGRCAEAECIYRGILEESPRPSQAEESPAKCTPPEYSHTLHLLGVLALQAGRYAEAVEQINQALALHGPHPVFLSNLAAAYLALDQLDEAASASAKAVHLEPALADAHSNLGVARMRQHRHGEAMAAFGEALRLNPAHVDARCHLASIMKRQGSLGDALALLEETQRLAPAHAQVQYELGGAYLALHEAERAVDHFQAALRLRPAFVEAHSNLGLALRELERFDEAIASFQEALRQKPAHAAAHDNLARTYMNLGKIKAAEAQFREGLRFDADNVRLLAGVSALALHGHCELTQEQTQRIEKSLSRSDVPAEDAVLLHFALGRARDRAGAYDDAFDHYRLGNELRKDYVRLRGGAFDREVHRAYMDRLIAVFSPAYFARVAGFGSDSECPIFVVGMMRSGTTLAEQILASHPEAYGAGELREIRDLTLELGRRFGAEYPECLAMLDANTARDLAESHVAMLRQRGGGKARVVDKMPANFLHLGLIATLFPRARIVHCRRDPRDTCVSCFVQNFGEPLGYALDLADLGAYYREYERLMAHWSRVLPMPIFELSYEELTAEQEPVSRRMLTYCGLSWDARCLRFYETDRPVRTASVLQVRKPMYRSAVGRWKPYERHLGPLLAAIDGG